MREPPGARPRSRAPRGAASASVSGSAQSAPVRAPPAACRPAACRPSARPSTHRPTGLARPARRTCGSREDADRRAHRAPADPRVVHGLGPGPQAPAGPRDRAVPTGTWHGRASRARAGQGQDGRDGQGGVAPWSCPAGAGIHGATAPRRPGRRAAGASPCGRRSGASQASARATRAHAGGRRVVGVSRETSPAPRRGSPRPGARGTGPTVALGRAACRRGEVRPPRLSTGCPPVPTGLSTRWSDGPRAPIRAGKGPRGRCPAPTPAPVQDPLYPCCPQGEDALACRRPLGFDMPRASTHGGTR